MNIKRYFGLGAIVVMVGVASNAFAGIDAAEGGVGEPIVSIKDYQFIPKEITVHKGEKILWINNEKRQYHSVWFESEGDPEPDYFFPDESFSRSFEKLGAFPYRCGPHPQMTGIVHVVE